VRGTNVVPAYVEPSENLDAVFATAIHGLSDAASADGTPSADCGRERARGHQKKTEPETETWFYISSLATKAENQGEAICGYRGFENRLH
jgi:hypothetical protein